MHIIDFILPVKRTVTTPVGLKATAFNNQVFQPVIAMLFFSRRIAGFVLEWVKL